MLTRRAGKDSRAIERSRNASPSTPAAQPESGNYAPGEALKERLARQEAAARMLDTPTPAAKAPEPVKSEPAARLDVAAAKPAAAPTPVTRLLQRVEPDFAREALQAGEDKGLVQARVTIDERGSVTRVEVLEAQPRRLFDRAVIRALSQWKYNEGAPGRTAEIEVALRK